MEIADETRAKFQSTRPVKDATSDIQEGYQLYKVSIHASREGRDEQGRIASGLHRVSIHASREGRDDLIAARDALDARFNPRVP